MDHPGNKWLFIINPAGGAGKVSRHWHRIEKLLLHSNLHFETAYTKGKKHAIELTREKIHSGFRKIAAVGGDGTFNEVINGIFTQAVVPTVEITFCLLPLGTGNDWVRTWHIPRKVERWITMLQTEKTALQDIGLVEYKSDDGFQTRYFGNVAGLAYDGFLIRFVESNQKKVSGKLYYLWLVLRCLFNYKPALALIESENGKTEGSFYTINAGICKYSGGGMQLVPHAVPDDGLLALTFAGKLSRLNIILNIWRFYTGTLGSHSRVQTLQSSFMTVKSNDERPVFIEVDGEFLGEAPCRFSIKKESLKIVIP